MATFDVKSLEIDPIKYVDELSDQEIKVLIAYLDELGLLVKEPGPANPAESAFSSALLKLAANRHRLALDQEETVLKLAENL